MYNAQFVGQHHTSWILLYIY